MSAEVFIPLTQGKVAVIDFEDFEKVRGFSWHAKKNGKQWYAQTSVKQESPFVPGRGKSIKLHQFLLSRVVKPLEIAHIDGDGLNNRRNNIEVVHVRFNKQGPRLKRVKTTSRYRGVVWDKDRNKWRAQIGGATKSRLTNLGRFDKEDDAARAYDTAAKKYFGRFAALNF